jgi:tripartite-type tricarboxylate transporter receptor subunit TctC
MKLAKVIFLLTGLALFVAAPAEAQVRKTIRFVVPVAAGGSYDLMARIIADKLSQDRDAVIVENMPGAAMLNGMGAVARAAPDGQTIGLMLSPVTVQPALVARMPFDIMKDIAPATLIGWNYNVLVVIPSLPVTSVKELITYARAHPGELNFGSGGNATPAHIAGEFFKLLTATEMTHVPYRSLAAVIQDMLAGRVQLWFGNASDALPQIQVGKLRALAVVGQKRLPALPDVPSMAEVGLPEISVPAWAGIVAPGGSSPDVIAQLNRDIIAVLALPDVREKLAANQTIIETDTPEEFRTLIAADIERWGRVVKDAHIKTE